MEFDYLIVGAGITGATIARELTDAGKKVKVIEQRNHIAGNCYSADFNGLPYGLYGGHIFHTNNSFIWKYVNKFSNWNQYQHKVVVNYNDKLFSFPINLMTFYQLWGIYSKQDVIKKLDSVKLKISNPSNFEEKALSLVGEEIYQTFFYGYTKKQWNTEPKNLSPQLLSRIPIRFNFNDDYFTAKHQGLPENGFTDFIGNMLHGIDVETNVEFDSKDESYWLGKCKKIFYTGTIDGYYKYILGKLDYRSLRFEWLEGVDVGASTMNYTSESVPFTRIISFNNFYNSDKKLSMREYPSDTGEPFYPIGTQRNADMYLNYYSIPNHRVVFCGRLGMYKYIDMDQAIGIGLKIAFKELTNGSF